MTEYNPVALLIFAVIILPLGAKLIVDFISGIFTGFRE